MSKLFIIFINLSIFLNTIYCARILGLFPIPSISHQNSYRPLMETLSDKGHQVVTFTTHPIKYVNNEHPNLTQISPDKNIVNIWKDNLNLAVVQERFGWLKFMIRTKNLMNEFYERVLNSSQFQDFIKDQNRNFDLCIIAASSPIFFAIKDRFNCSLILISSTAALSSIFEAFGNPTNPIAYPPFLSLNLENVTFKQRLFSSLIDWLFRLIQNLHYPLECDKMVKKYFGDGYRPIIEIQNDADMLFMNEGSILAGNRPIVSNTIYFFGMHLKPNKPLPEELKTILDKATNGAIYLSLGSNVKSIHLSQSRIDAFLEAFKELSYTVLWKWENETMIGKPDNVYISKWYPQQDVLAHPNIKVFITQGGQQSMEEAIHHKVPLIGMPFMGDQDLNVKKMIKFGIGTEMDLHTLSKEIIVYNINKVIKDPSYRENIEKLSDLLEDQPQTSMERAVWWTEYVLRHKGAKHLKSPATKIPFYQYFMLDIIAFVSVCIIITITLTVVSCRLIYRKLFKSAKDKVKTS